jgi:hypothetical protein
MIAVGYASAYRLLVAQHVIPRATRAPPNAPCPTRGPKFITRSNPSDAVFVNVNPVSIVSRSDLVRLLFWSAIIAHYRKLSPSPPARPAAPASS